MASGYIFRREGRAKKNLGSKFLTRPIREPMHITREFCLLICRPIGVVDIVVGILVIFKKVCLTLGGFMLVSLGRRPNCFIWS